MAQAGFTPISLYNSATAAAVPTAGNLVAGELAINTLDGKLYYKNSVGVVTLLASTSGASGDVVGPASATDNALARFDLTTGKLIQNSVAILSDAGALSGLTGVSSSSITNTGLTSGRVVYSTTGGLETDSANLTFDGTNLTLLGGTANGVAFLNGSKVLTTGSALVFDGTNLGIGVTPVSILHAKAASPIYTQETTGNVTSGGVAYQQFKDSTGITFIQGFAGLNGCYQFGTTIATGFMRFLTGAAGEAMRIDASQNVSVGVSSTNGFWGSSSLNAKTVISQSSSGTAIDTADKALVLVNSNTTTSNTTALVFGATNTGGTGIAQAAVYSINGTRGGAFNTGQLGFAYANASGALIEAMRIDSSGNVGIGTSSPSVKLDVTGNVNVSGQLLAGTSGSVVAPLVVGAYVAGTSNLYIRNLGGANRIDSYNDPITANYPLQILGSPIIFATADVERMRISATGDVLVTTPVGLGYGTGSGGTVTQATSKSTGVTLNKPTGQITMNNAALLPTTSVVFLLSNSLLAATDSLIVQPNYGANSQSYTAQVTFSGAGGAYIRVTNESGGSLSEAVTLSFAIIKGATS